MNRILLAIVFAAWTSQAAAAQLSCADQAKEKKLAGAAQASFMQKCEADRIAQLSCADQAKEKKLAGAAHDSFVKKCVGDAAGSAPAPAKK